MEAPQQAPSPYGPNLMGGPQGVPMAQSPIRLPDGRAMGGGSIMRQRSVFDETVRGNGAQLKQVNLLGGGRPVLQDSAVPTVTMGRIPAPHAPPPAAGPVTTGPNLWLGADIPLTEAVQPSAIERVVQREMPSEGFSPQEAGALADALSAALQAASLAVAEEVACGNVDTFIVQEVRVMQGMLQRFSSTGAAADRFKGLAPEDIAKIDAVLACQSTYEEVSRARNAQTTALVVGGIVVGGIVLAIVA